MNQHTDNRIAHFSVGNVCGVYLLTDTSTGATYVGASQRVRARLAQHFGDMLRRPNAASYKTFAVTLRERGSRVFSVELLQECTPAELAAAERVWIQRVQPTENSYLCVDGRRVYTTQTRERKAIAAQRLWADPEYRSKAVAARAGKAYNKGYRCTEEQVQNRKRAARISNMKRNYGADWAQEYARRYPEHVGDLHG